MRGGDCWTIENYAYRECRRPAREFPYAVSLHNHSSRSVENLASLNQVVKLSFMRPLSGTLRWAFGFERSAAVNYTDLIYNPPYSPEDVLRTESNAARSLGFGGIHFAITDHDECAGGVELLERRPDLSDHIAIGEEVSIRFQGHVFHLGVTGLPLDAIGDTHRRIQAVARGGALDDLFEFLAASGCLVVFNHPLIPWGPGGEARIPAADLLARYGWAIHALEYNGMRGVRRTTGFWNWRGNGASRWPAGATATYLPPVPWSALRGPIRSPASSPRSRTAGPCR
jgi:hypothetical protein